jgi:DNA-binding beta-propeller fold protein YncE
VLKIAGPGVVTTYQILTPNTTLTGSQSVAFNRAGTKAYVMCTQPLPDPYPTDPTYPGPNNVIRVLNVTGPGTASDANVSIEVNIYGRSQLFGVDTLAMDNVGRYLYVSNPTLSGAKNYIQVVDTVTNTMVKTITFANIDVPDAATPPVYTSTVPIAAGISFWRR